MKQVKIVLILLVCSAGSYAAFFDGDLNRDLRIDLSDLMIFAEQWLDPSGCSGRKDCADMDGLGGVNFSDLTVIAKRWMMDTLTPIITEFSASNTSLLRDEDGQSSDWIEIYNPLSYAIDLTGWALTDNKEKPTKWPFPEMTLDAGQYLVVFASNKDRDDSASELHTNFVLDPDGEYLALTMDNGGTVVQEFDHYPRQYRDVSYGLSQQAETELNFVDKESMQGYFVAPTHGTKNGVAEAVIGPMIHDILHLPELPADTNDLVVTAAVSETTSAIDSQSIQLHYRVMYGPEVAVSMADDGAGSDITANDGIYTGVIPAAASSSKEMVRYYITASDIQENTTRFPLYKSPQFSEQYYGTVIGSNTVQTQIDLFLWFVEDPTWYIRPSDGLYTDEYTASSLFYKGRFYDNVRTRIRGASSVVHKFPKQSLKLEFNQENRFYYSPEMDKLDEINVNALSVDKGFIRNHLSMNVFRDSGSPYSTSDMWLCYQNGQFHSVANFVEQVDEQYLKRNDLPANGSLYKIFNYLDNSADRPAWYPGVNPDTLDGVEKKTRQWEDNSDLQALVDGMKTSTNRARFLFDHINIPEVINVMCGNIINQCWDRFEKNYYMYCDTEGSGQWYLLPWDQDLGWGYLGWMNDNLSGTHSTMSHPLYGEQEHPNAYGQWHRLDEAMLDDPTIRQMYLRRLRTVLDEQLQAPTTPANERKLEAYINQMIAQIGTEVDADKAKWGVTFGSFRYFQAEMNMLIKNYLVPKRNTLYITHGPSGTGLLPEAQVGNPMIVLGDYQVNPGANIINDPAISPQECEYVELENPNSYAIDISGWKLTGGVEFTFKPGTIIASHSSLYVCPNVKAFLMRNESPKGGEGLFVVGAYDGYLSNWGETVNLLAADGAMIDTFSYAANPSDQQRYLRISEMMYHPSTPDGVTAFEDEDFEYIELKNTGTESLSLVGVRLTDGVSYAFPLTSSYSEKLDLLDYTDAWNYDQTDTDLGTSWRQSGYDDAGWLSGAGLLYVEPSDLPEPKNTLLTLGPRTFYFRTHFNFPSAPSDYESVELKLSTILDDGAVVYLNGQEVFRLGVSEGQTHSSLSSRLVGDAVVEGPFVILSDNLVQGDNVLVVEVHQQSDSSSDVVWGCQLQAIVTTQTAGQRLQPEQHIVICKNAEAFAERYDLTGILIADGNYTGNLSNSGERIKLEDVTGSTIQSFSYKDGWYPVTDGGGFSLTVIDTTAANDLNKKSSWKPSSTLGGSPGQADTGSIPLPGSIVINELLAHSHDVAPDWIELYNTTDQPINIGGWYISDSGSTDEALMKYQIPLGTIIPAYGFAVFYEETDFTDFAFSVNGETAYLTSAVDGQLGSYRISESFGASPTGIAFGRYYKASTDSYNFVPMSTNTPGAANAYPLVGPLVISEIMYHPSQFKDAEYVELLNISNETVHLYDVAKGAGWKFADDGGFEFYFPANSAIAPGERILIVKNPVAFASEFTAAAGTQIFAWSGDGNLSNSGEEIQLSMPGDIDSEGTRYYIRIDRVVYSDGSHPEDADPWPDAADGNGQSLHRIDHNAYGNDVVNWTAAAPTPGM